jgi:outer membrane protein TolC
MSFLRRFFLWLAVSQVGNAWMIAAGTEGPAATPPALVQALPENALSPLESLLKEGLSDAPTVLIRRWEAEQARENARAARAPMLPNAHASVQGGVIFEQRDDGGAKSDRTLQAILYNVGVEQPIFHWGALKKNYQVSKLARAISARNVDETRRLLAVDLRRRYFDLVIATGAVTQAKKGIAELNRQLDFAKKQVEDGFAATTASSTVVAQITASEINLQRLENDRDTLARNLARMVGVTVEALPPVVDELPKPPELDALVKGLPADSPGLPSVRLQNAEETVRMEALRYDIEKTRLLPKVGTSFYVSQDNRNPDNNDLGPKALITSWNAFVTVNWQLFDGFSSQAAKRASLARKRVYEEDRDTLAAQEADERRADVSRLQLSWRQLQQAELTLSGYRGSVAAIEKDVAAGWTPESEAEIAREAADAALQAINVARADFYTMLATYFSNRGLDPALGLSTR